MQKTGAPKLLDNHGRESFMSSSADRSKAVRPAPINIDSDDDLDINMSDNDSDGS